MLLPVIPNFKFGQDIHHFRRKSIGAMSLSTCSGKEFRILVKIFSISSLRSHIQFLHKGYRNNNL
jgi:hypothetical protein